MDHHLPVLLVAWRAASSFVAKRPTEFAGASKETKVFRVFRHEIETIGAGVRVAGPDVQATFGQWSIDLVCDFKGWRVAVEGKYKIIRDGAVPDNRKAAFFDLYKLERYVDSGEYAAGLFLWLTNNAAYTKRAAGDSRDFSTHQGRVYEPATQLSAARSRNRMPLPLALTRRYSFLWETVDASGLWRRLALPVVPNAA